MVESYKFFMYSTTEGIKNKDCMRNHFEYSIGIKLE